MKHRKVFMLTLWHAFAVATLASSMAFIAVVLYWTLEPFGKPVISIKNDRIAVEPKVVTAGQTIYLIYSFCKHGKPQSAKVRRYLKDELVYFLPTLESNVQPGCQDHKVGLDIPKNLPPDKYTYNVEIEYRVNPIKTSTYYFTSDEFVVKAE